jgi:TetR/AcrR family transcriptional regulator, tetracycline repressor protein
VPPPKRRPGRPRPGRPVLTRPAILAAALDLVDEAGIEALSMRKLADRLGVDPMSIYHHLPNKAAIVSGLVASVFSTMAPVPADDPWRDRVRAWAHAYRDLALAHPNLVLQIVTDSAAASDAAILISEPLYAAFDAAGLAPWDVSNAAGALVDFVNGYALAAGAAARVTGDPMGDRLAALPPGEAPTMRRVAAAVSTAPTGTGFFDACVEIIIRGVASADA